LFVFFFLLSSVVSRITRDGSGCEFWCAVRALLAASAAVWVIRDLFTLLVRV
jgi:hypothetical protein